MSIIPGHCSHNVPDYSNLPLKNISELSEEERLGPGLRQRGAGSDGDQREAGDQEQGGLHNDEILGKKKLLLFVPIIRNNKIKKTELYEKLDLSVSVVFSD